MSKYWICAIDIYYSSIPFQNLNVQKNVGSSLETGLLKSGIQDSLIKQASFP